MDPLTHGLAGALIAKAFFNSGAGKRKNQQDSLAGATGPEPSPGDSAYSAAVWTTTLAALFPDADIVLGPLSRSPVGTIELHRWVTHSFLCLPVFALLLAALARWWFVRRRGAGQPAVAVSFFRLTFYAGVGIASHILLDLITSWGTMAWSPLSRQRVAWDLVFIIDFVLTGLLVVPQLAAWVFATPAGRSVRARRAWGATSLAAVCAGLAVQLATPALPWTAIGVSFALLGMLFYAPAYRGWGFRVRRAVWCRAGVLAVALYVAACGIAHNAALRRVQDYASARGLAAENLAAVPLPPSLARWAGLVRTADGVHQAIFSVLDAAPPDFRFVPHQTPPDALARARQIREVQIYLWFARFPVARYSRDPCREIIIFNDLRFPRPLASRPAPFEYRVVFDAGGRLLEQGWVVD